MQSRIPERLDSWKSISGYLGREVRTVQRWAVRRNLPVHHLPGGKKPRVYALKSEIDEWLIAGGGGEPADLPSIAVLPFASLSENPADQFFGDGLADDIIDSLARLEDLRVTARTSSFAFRSLEQDVREIGRRLGAANLLEGSVRRIGDRVRVSAQLVSSDNGYHLWSQSYDRQLLDILAIQSEIAHSIALALKLRLAPIPAAKRPTPDLKAYEFWVKGRSTGAPLNYEAVHRARECFAAAIASDPTFAQPYADAAAILFHASEFGINESADWPQQARRLILDALERDDSLSEAHALLGMVRGLIDYDWAGAELSFQRALQITPGSAFVLARHAWYCLLPQRKIGQALLESEEAVAQDPFSPSCRTILGLAAMAAHDAARAEQECRVAMEMAPGSLLPQWCLGGAMMLRGKLIQGFRHCARVYDRFPNHPSAIAGMCMMYAQFFQRRKARRLLAQLIDLARSSYVPPVSFAVAYLGLRDERAYEWFDKAIDARDPGLTQLASLPFFDHARSDPRFQALLARMNLP